MNKKILNITDLENFIFAKLSNELSPDLSYHGINHTKSVLNCCREYAKRMNISPYNSFLLDTAALMHDTGYLVAFDEHEEKSKEYARELLPHWNYSADEIEQICGMIDATKIPQKPNTTLEQIIADSDLDYLGTDKFYTVGEMLYKELKALKIISMRKEWLRLQVNFLKKHIYHTPFAKRYREPVKLKHLEEIINDLN
ncbi:MAG TPA: HD domain-containing protein [Draconibacterium sp.]|nr:HD domain-containing protein [Draconibacterium sp.]